MYNYYPNEPRYCERIRECACINGLQCTFSQDQDHGGPVGVVPGGGYYCGSPGIVSGPDVMAAGDTQHDTNTCNTTRCDDPYPAYPNLGVDNNHPFGSDPAFAIGRAGRTRSGRASPPASVTATTIRCRRRPINSAATTGRIR